MEKHLFRNLLFVFIGSLLIGCATPVSLAPFKAADLNQEVRSGRYVQKVDNFLIILDASGSMEDQYKGKVKLDIAKNFVHRMNQTIPDLKLSGGLRKFAGTSPLPGRRP